MEDNKVNVSAVLFFSEMLFGLTLNALNSSKQPAPLIPNTLINKAVSPDPQNLGIRPPEIHEARGA